MKEFTMIFRNNRIFCVKFQFFIKHFLLKKKILEI